MKTLTKLFSKYLTFAVLLVAVIAGRLMVYGDTVFFIGPGIPGSCSHSSQFKHGDNIGFRMTAINPETGKRDRGTQLVVHITYGGKTVDLPMHDRQNDRQPEREFWIAKWPVPDDATTGIVRYTVTAKDPQGRTGEYKPFDVNDASHFGSSSKSPSSRKRAPGRVGPTFLGVLFVPIVPVGRVQRRETVGLVGVG